MRADFSVSCFSGETEVIPSKSYYIRALILSALSDNPVKLIGKNLSDDVLAAVDAVKALGAKVQANPDGFTVTPPEKMPDYVDISVGESATLLRILTPVLAAKGISARISAEGSLKSRPVYSLIKPLAEHGIKFTKKAFPLEFSGRLTSGRYVLTDTTTSGVISGLIIALSTLEGDSEISADLNSFNKGYIDVTLDVVRAFGADVTAGNKHIEIKGGKPLSAENYVVEADWSNAAAWLVGGALTGSATVDGLNLTSAQYDRRILEFLSEMGAKIIISENSVTVQKAPLQAITCDMGKNLDIVPVLAVACATASGKSCLMNIERLALKESDRITEICRLLSALSIKSTYDNGNLTIFGGNPAYAETYTAPRDHRLIMAAAIAGAVCGMSVDNVQGISKSYPEFFEIYAKMGGKIQ